MSLRVHSGTMGSYYCYSWETLAKQLAQCLLLNKHRGGAWYPGGHQVPQGPWTQQTLKCTEEILLRISKWRIWELKKLGLPAIMLFPTSWTSYTLRNRLSNFGITFIYVNPTKVCLNLKPSKILIASNNM